ncbi:MAG: 5'/3'-nucleotidase SurE [Chitinophagaceae bacterium]
MEKKANRPIILVTNDDGITAPGIRNLVEAVRQLGEVIVVAPDAPQSGMGHAVTIGTPLRLNRVDIFEGIEAWQCSGTPVDCVKLARDKILHRRPDICVSGINHGANHAINIFYSGTMSAAMEAAMEGVPSAGFSLLDFSYDADFSVAAMVAKSVATKLLEKKLPPHTLLNVNIPKLPKEHFKGMKICRQANAHWEEEFDHRVDPHGKDYYWMVGAFVNDDRDNGTDVAALEEGFASIVPVHYDLTDYALKTRLETDWKDLKI